MYSHQREGLRIFVVGSLLVYPLQPLDNYYHHYHYFYHSLLFVVGSVLFYPHQPLHVIIWRNMLIEALGLNNDSDSHSHGFGHKESDRHGNDP